MKEILRIITGIIVLEILITIFTLCSVLGGYHTFLYYFIWGNIIVWGFIAIHNILGLKA